MGDEEGLNNGPDRPFGLVMGAHSEAPRWTRGWEAVVDEVGYLTYSSDAANVLYHVVNERHLKRRTMVFTTNKPLSRWGAVLHDDDLAEAIVDRVLERGRLLKLDGPSHRAPAAAGDPNPPEKLDSQPARVSGTERPEFPEPTEGLRIG